MEKNNANRTKPIWPYIPVAFPLMLLVSSSVVYPYVKALDLRLDFFPMVFINAVWLLLFSAAFRKAKTTAALTLTVLACGAVIALQYWLGSQSKTPTEFNQSIDYFFYWAGNYLAGNRFTHVLHSQILAGIYSFIVCFAVAFFTIRKLDALIVSICGAICFVSLVVIGHTVNLPSLFACILGSALYFLLQNFVVNAREVPGARGKGVTAYMLSALPFAAVLLALTIGLSTILKIDPAWMKETRDKLIKKNTSVTDTLSQLSGSMTVSVTELGGPALLNDEVMMEVQSPVSNVYLRGKSKDVYTGHSWEKSDANGVSVKPDTFSFDDVRELEEASAMYGYTSGNAGQLAQIVQQPVQITVRYKGMKPGLAYLPQKTKRIEPAGEASRFIVVGKDELYIQYQRSDAMAYQATFILPLRSSEVLVNILRGCHTGIYGEYWQKYSNGMMDTGSEEDNQAIMDALIDRQSMANGIYKQYRQLPDSLPQRVRDLAAEITKDKATDYDKAKAIEAYLSQNYTYTLTPGSYDKTKDFVDEFLFNGGEGYCTYYATAMTVLLRCAGIPARYVEGYVMPGNHKNGVFLVTKRQGHAWVEAYFEGFGWYPFEPTASFSMAGNAPASTPRPSPSDTPRATPSKLPAPSAEPSSKPASAPANRLDLTLTLLILTAAAAGLLVLAAVPVRSGVRMRAMAPREAAQAVFAQYLRLLSARGLEIKNGEPMLEFAERLDLPGITPEEFCEAVKVFQLARYSPHEIMPEQKQLMLAFRLKLLRACRRALGPARYWYYRYIWGI